MLLDIKTYLQQHHRADLKDIALHLNAQPDAVRSMMQHWIKKKKVRALSLSCPSAQCSKCTSSSEMYEWLDNTD